MRTVVLGPRPPLLEQLLEQRLALGIDRYDEIWNGEYHMSPAPSGPHALVDDEIAAALRARSKAAGLHGSGPFNLGTKEDYRIPDRGYHRVPPRDSFTATAELVVEILSSDDETFEKFSFYATHGVEEILVVDPAARAVTIFGREGDRYLPMAASRLLAVEAETLTAEIGWPDFAD